MFDFDNFQMINSSFGFKAGDQYLKKVSQSIKSIIPSHFCFSRLGADQFAACVTQMSKDKIYSLANKIRQQTKEFNLCWNNECIIADISVGVVIIDDQFSKIDHLLSAAVHACRLAKQKGGGIIQYYDNDDPDIQRHSQDIKCFHDILQALTLNRFQLFCQKIHTINEDDQHSKYEILVRMLDSDNKIVSPGIFIPAAEKYGAMNKIDRWVVENSFRKISSLGNGSKSSYAINLSGTTLGDFAFIDFVYETFKRYKIEPNRIIFEITETSAISHIETADKFMSAMLELGCQFSLDDFGTGLASFDYLKKLPIQYIKIDGSFVRDMTKNKIDYSFIEAIQKIATSMKIKTVAEFVESAEILTAIKELNIDYAQGYHIHKPELWYAPPHND